MMKRDTLLGLKWVSRKFSFYATTQQVQQLTDSHLEAYDKIDELMDEVRNLSRQLDDANEELGLW